MTEYGRAPPGFYTPEWMRRVPTSSPPSSTVTVGPAPPGFYTPDTGTTTIHAVIPPPPTQAAEEVKRREETLRQLEAAAKSGDITKAREYEQYYYQEYLPAYTQYEKTYGEYIQWLRSERFRKIEEELRRKGLTKKQIEAARQNWGYLAQTARSPQEFEQKWCEYLTPLGVYVPAGISIFELPAAPPETPEQAARREAAFALQIDRELVERYISSGAYREKEYLAYAMEQAANRAFAEGVNAAATVVTQTAYATALAANIGAFAMASAAAFAQLSPLISAAGSAVGTAARIVAVESAGKLAGIAGKLGPAVSAAWEAEKFAVAFKFMAAATQAAVVVPAAVEVFLTHQRISAGVSVPEAALAAAFELPVMYSFTLPMAAAVASPLYPLTPGAPGTVTELTEKGWVTYREHLGILQRISRALALKYGETAPYAAPPSATTLRPGWVPFRGVGYPGITADLGYKLKQGETLAWAYKPVDFTQYLSIPDKSQVRAFGNVRFISSSSPPYLMEFGQRWKYEPYGAIAVVKSETPYYSLSLGVEYVSPPFTPVVQGKHAPYDIISADASMSSVKQRAWFVRILKEPTMEMESGGGARGLITLGGEQEFFGSVAPGPTVISEMDYTISQTTGRLGEQLSRVGAVGTALSVWTLSLPAEKQGEAKISTLPALGVSGASLASPVFATKSSAASGAVQAMNTAATAAVKTGAAASVSTATVISAVSPQSFTFPVDLRLPPLLAQQSKQLTSRISKASAKITRTAEWKKLWPVGELGIGFGWKRRKR